MKFNEKTHTYTVEGKEYKSVTTFIGEFFNKFDEKAVARQLSKYPV